MPINFAAGFTICLFLEGPLALSSKILLWRYDQRRRRIAATNVMSRSLSQKKYEMEREMSAMATVEIGEQSLFRRLSRIPNLKPTKSVVDHQITRVE